ELLQLTGRRFNQRASLNADSLSVKAELAKATYQLSTLEDTLAERKEALNHRLGRSVRTEVAVEPVPATFPEHEALSPGRASALQSSRRNARSKTHANRFYLK